MERMPACVLAVLISFYAADTGYDASAQMCESDPPASMRVALSGPASFKP